MYNNINYDALGRANVSDQQQAQRQEAMRGNIQQLQIQKLNAIYPGMIFLKYSEMGQEYRVPLKLSVSPEPLYLKVSIPH